MGFALFRNRDQCGLSALRAGVEVNTSLGLQFRTSLEKHFVAAGIAGNLDQVCDPIVCRLEATRHQHFNPSALEESFECLHQTPGLIGSYNSDLRFLCLL